MKYKSLLIAAALGGSAIAPAAAQNSGLVVVDISNNRTEIAKDINVDVSQIPVTVQAPIGVAANVCGVAANVLTASLTQTGTAECDSTTTSTALNDIVQRQLKSQQ